MKIPRQKRLTDYLSENRILVRIPSIPRVKVLLALAQTMTRDGSVRNPLEFYQDLANLSTPWIALENEHQTPNLKIYQVSSLREKRLTAALGLCPEGAILDEHERAHIVLLFSTPEELVSSYQALLAHVVCLLHDKSRREALLGSQYPAEVWSHLARMEAEAVTAQNP